MNVHKVLITVTRDVATHLGRLHAHVMLDTDWPMIRVIAMVC